MEITAKFLSINCTGNSNLLLIYCLSRYQYIVIGWCEYVIRKSTNQVTTGKYEENLVFPGEILKSSLRHSAIRLNFRTYQKISHTTWSLLDQSEAGIFNWDVINSSLTHSNFRYFTFSGENIKIQPNLENVTLPENRFIFYPAVRYSPLVGWGNSINLLLWRPTNIHW